MSNEEKTFMLEKLTKKLLETSFKEKKEGKIIYIEKKQAIKELIDLIKNYL